MTDETSKSDKAVSGMADADKRAGFVALIGAPNAGKSTLLNRLVGSKVSIVTHKVQTTRALIRGIAIHNETQIIFVDTPGIFEPRKGLERAMVKTAWSGSKDADLTALLIDSRRGLTDEVKAILDRLATSYGPKLLILNKIDLVERTSLLELTKLANEKVDFSETFMMSAANGDGTKEFMDYVASHLPAGPWLYPEDQLSDMPLRSLAAEVTREKLMLRLHSELPYAATVETEEWADTKDGGVRIGQAIFVERDSQKKIVIGKGGETIKAISQHSRHELSELMQRPVHLFLYVKVRKNWSDDPARLREIGLEPPV